MLCPQCGKEIDDTAAFCQYCGKKVGSESEQFSIMKDHDAPNSSLSQKAVRLQSDKKEIAIIVAIIVGIIAAFCIYHYSLFGVNTDLSGVIGNKIWLAKIMHPVKKLKETDYYCIGNYILLLEDNGIVKGVTTNQRLSGKVDNSHNIYGAYIGQSKSKAKKSLERKGLTSITSSVFENDSVLLIIEYKGNEVYSLDCGILSDKDTQKKAKSLKQDTSSSDTSEDDTSTDDTISDSNSYSVFSGASDSVSEAEKDTPDNAYDDSDDEDVYSDDAYSDDVMDTYDDSEEESDSDYYILPDSDCRKLTKEDLLGLSKEELRLARNEIYARHGRRFQDEQLQEYFDTQDWYDGYIDPEDFIDSVELTALERRNAKFILKFE